MLRSRFIVVSRKRMVKDSICENLKTQSNNVR